MPEPCRGQRTTDRLSPRAVRQIKGAALKAEMLGFALKTFVTFTVRQEERIDFIVGELVLGQEIKRTLNALNEWMRRRELPALHYIWVAENKGDANPHLHMLTDYSVPRSEFDAFAMHLESLWGHGFAKIERVREPKKAGRYILKALGYAMKGTDEGQGTVRGNRYGISRDILPTYETFDLYECTDAAEGLAAMQDSMTDDIEEVAPGLWLTKYGLSFEAGTELGRVLAVVRMLGEPPA